MIVSLVFAAAGVWCVVRGFVGLPLSGLDVRLSAMDVELPR